MALNTETRFAAATFFLSFKGSTLYCFWAATKYIKQVPVNVRPAPGESTWERVVNKKYELKWNEGQKKKK